MFRSLLTPLSLMTTLTPLQTIFITPLCFGVAHIHHLYEFRLTHQTTSFLVSLLTSLFQFTYTTIFGWYASFLFVRTGSLLAVTLTHSFCNWIGLPRFWGKVEAGVPIGPPSTGHHHSRKVDHGSNDELSIWWTVTYYVLLVTGAVCFWKYFWVLTESNARLATI
jgi:prenyl protein peptidase